VNCHEIHYVCEGKERTKLLLTPEGQHLAADEVDNSNNSVVHTANEVLLISLGMSNDCPGMLSEQKVCIPVATTLFIIHRTIKLITLTNGALK